MTALRPARLPGPVAPRRRGLVWGLALLVPRCALAWFLGLDAAQLIASFLLLAGLVLIGIWAFRRVLMTLGDRTLWWVFLAGAAAVILAGAITTSVGTTGKSFAYAAWNGQQPLFVPPSVVLYQYAWTLVGALWVIGVVFALGAPLLSRARRRLAHVEPAPPPRRR